MEERRRRLLDPLADSDEAGHPFRREGGHPFRGEGGHPAGRSGEQGSWWIEVAALRPLTASESVIFSLLFASFPTSPSRLWELWESWAGGGRGAQDFQGVWEGPEGGRVAARSFPYPVSFHSRGDGGSWGAGGRPGGGGAPPAGARASQQAAVLRRA